jgi:PIN domain nuclease of toxin-antitoxin system
MLNLDTHILLGALSDQLLPAERRLLVSDSWSISSIVLWEIAKLARMGRIEFDLDSPEMNQALARIHVWPLDRAVCRQSVLMDFKSDPADEIIAATSVVHKVPLLTRDRRIRQSKLVPLARK